MPPADGSDAAAADKSSFRWIDAARYVVASLVAVLIVAFIVNAITLFHRRPHDSLFFSVIGGSVQYKVRILPSPPTLVLQLGLRVVNPSKGAQMYYVDITGYLFHKNFSAASMDPSSDCLVSFPVKDKAVAQQKTVVALVEITARRKINMPASYFDALYSGNGRTTVFRDVTMRLDGTLITKLSLGRKVFSLSTTYYCPQLVVGGGVSPDDDAFKNRPDVVCSTGTPDFSGS